jgi:hypothetical protein
MLGPPERHLAPTSPHVGAIRADVDGVFEVAALPPGRYRLRGHVGGVEHESAEVVAAEPGGEVDATFTLLPVR